MGRQRFQAGRLEARDRALSGQMKSFQRACCQTAGRQLPGNVPLQPIREKRQIASRQVVVETRASLSVELQRALERQLEPRARHVKLLEVERGIFESRAHAGAVDGNIADHRSGERQVSVDRVIGQPGRANQQVADANRRAARTCQGGGVARIEQCDRRVHAFDVAVVGAFEGPVGDRQRHSAVGQRAVEEARPAQSSTAGQPHRVQVRPGALDEEVAIDDPDVPRIPHPIDVETLAEPLELDVIDGAFAAVPERHSQRVDGAGRSVGQACAKEHRVAERRPAFDERRGELPGDVVVERERALDVRNRNLFGHAPQVHSACRSNKSKSVRLCQTDGPSSQSDG